MPATAGWVRMPSNNRVAVSASLRTHAIWKDSVGYDPYAPEKQGDVEDEALRDKAKELLTLARLTGTVSTHTPGACTKCGQVGHLSFQCRNDITFSSGREQTVAVVNSLKKKEDAEDDLRLRRVLGIGSDDEEKKPGGAPVKRRRRSSDCSSSSTETASSSSSGDGSHKKRKKTSKKHAKDKKRHRSKKEKKSRKKKRSRR